MPKHPAFSVNSRSMTWTYAGALALEVVVLLALWTISRVFG